MIIIEKTGVFIFLFFKFYIPKPVDYRIVKQTLMMQDRKKSVPDIRQLYSSLSKLRLYQANRKKFIPYCQERSEETSLT